MAHQPRCLWKPRQCAIPGPFHVALPDHVRDPVAIWIRKCNRIFVEHYVFLGPKRNGKRESSADANSLLTWNLNDLYFWRSTPQNKGLNSSQNKGHQRVPGRYYSDVFGRIANHVLTPPTKNDTWWGATTSSKYLVQQPTSTPFIKLHHLWRNTFGHKWSDQEKTESTGTKTSAKVKSP